MEIKLFGVNRSIVIVLLILKVRAIYREENSNV
jgi:hypothetical protein